jgi:hypothetical protein
MSQGMKEPILQIGQDGGHLYRLEKVKALQLTSGNLHALLFPSLSRYFGLNFIILLKSLVFYLLGGI